MTPHIIISTLAQDEWQSQISMAACDNPKVLWAVAFLDRYASKPESYDHKVIAGNFVYEDVSYLQTQQVLIIEFTPSPKYELRGEQLHSMHALSSAYTLRSMMEEQRTVQAVVKAIHMLKQQNANPQELELVKRILLPGGFKN